MNALILGLGWVTATGMGCGKDGGRFSMTTTGPASIDRSDVFEQPYKNFGRMDEYSRLGLSAVAFALRDAGMETVDSQRDIGLVAHTRYGCLWTDIDYYRSALPNRGTMASPNLFAYTLPNCFMGEAAIRFGLTGESYIINEAAASDLTVLELAVGSIASGESEFMICGRCDLGRPPLLDSAEEVAAGALFFVVADAPVAQQSTYGMLGFSDDGRIVFEDETVQDLSMLARKCLRLKHQQS